MNTTIIPSSLSSKTRNASSTTTAVAPLSSQPLSSPYTLVTASRYFAISPAYSTNPTLGIQHDHLDPLVFKYDPTLGGVVLLHQNLRFKATTAKVMYESPFAYTWVDVDFILWKPREGMVLEGWVNNASPSHVGLLFANVFSVAVAKGGIPKAWKWVDEEDEDKEGYDDGYGTTLGHWEDESGNLVKDLVRFVVVAVKVDGGMLSLEGSFVGKQVNKPDVVDITMQDVAGMVADQANDTQKDDDETRRKKEKKEKKKKRKDA